jgi:ABC-type thiamine transport system ATPase subunit
MTLQIAIQKQQGDFSLDLAITAGDGVTALFGRSGAGKSTVINAVAGLVTPDSGHIQLGIRFSLTRPAVPFFRCTKDGSGWCSRMRGSSRISQF